MEYYIKEAGGGQIMSIDDKGKEVFGLLIMSYKPCSAGDVYSFSIIEHIENHEVVIDKHICLQSTIPSTKSKDVLHNDNNTISPSKGDSIKGPAVS